MALPSHGRLIAKRQIEIAEKEGADAVSHGATGKGNDQVRFELTYFALKPGIRIVAPCREWSMKGREELIDYADKHRIPVTATKSKPFSTDRNLLHISYEGGVLEDPWAESTQDMYTLAFPVERAPDKAEYVEVDYEAGNPVATNGKRLSPAALLAEANRIAGAHGVGRVDLVENRYGRGEAGPSAGKAPFQHEKNFLDCVKSREKPNADIEVGRLSTTLCHLGNISHHLKRDVRFDPATESFPGDAAANALLEKSYRASYPRPAV